jgi:hypothetical protein
MLKTDRKSTFGDRFITFVVVAAAMLAYGGAMAQVTGTVSQAEPPAKQDGTPAHPYSDAGQCPARTDVVFWPSGNSVPSIPPSISVCFVGNQPFENSGPARIEVRDR